MTSVHREYVLMFLSLVMMLMLVLLIHAAPPLDASILTEIAMITMPAQSMHVINILDVTLLPM
jgi:hypothetical protein